MISLHLVADNSDPKRIDRAIDYLANTKQTAVNVAGGSQIDVAMNIVDRIHKRMPDIKVFFRVLEDTGNIFKMSTNQWWTERVQPRLKWMQDNRVVMVIDNESSGDDSQIVSYVTLSIERLKKLHEVGLGGAFCRFATGNIQESQYILLKPLLDQLTDKDWISPNEYSNAPGKSSAGHLERYKRIEAVTPKKLNIAIGECGILNDYLSDKGYRSIPMSGKDMAAQMLADEMWYKGGTIPRFLFCIGGYSQWDSLQVGDDALEFLESYYDKNPIQQKPPTPIPPVEQPKPIESMVTIPLSLLVSIRKEMQGDIDLMRRYALQLGALSDDMLKDSQLIDAIIEKASKT